MGKIKNFSKGVLIFALLFSLMTGFVYAGNEPKEVGKDGLIKSYTYISSEKDKRDDSIQDKIKHNNTTYKLKNIEYNSKPLKITEKVTTGDKENFTKTIEKKIGEKVYKFEADVKNIKWDERKEKITLSENIEYKNRNEVPGTITKDGYTLNLEGVSSRNKLESFSAPARFFSYEKNASTYIFNGKKVEIGNSPIWSGYENDIKNYLGINGASYSITGGSFTTENTLIDEASSLYERTAIFTGTRNVPYYLATYIYDGESNDKNEYTANVDYIANGKWETVANVTYEAENSLFKTILTYGAGIGVGAIAAAAVIFLLKKKKKNKADNDAAVVS